MGLQMCMVITEVRKVRTEGRRLILPVFNPVLPHRNGKYQRNLQERLERFWGEGCGATEHMK